MAAPAMFSLRAEQERQRRAAWPSWPAGGYGGEISRAGLGGERRGSRYDDRTRYAEDGSIRGLLVCACADEHGDGVGSASGSGAGVGG